MEIHMRPSPCSTDTLTWLAARPSVRVVHLQDPLVEALGFDAHSGYAEAYWLGILGPSALLGPAPTVRRPRPPPRWLRRRAGSPRPGAGAGRGHRSPGTGGQSCRPAC